MVVGLQIRARVKRKKMVLAVTFPSLNQDVELAWAEGHLQLSLMP